MFSNDLKNAMNKENISVPELAKYMAVTEQAVYNWLAGQRPMNKNFFKLCKLFELHAEDYTLEMSDCGGDETIKKGKQFNPKPPVRDEAKKAFEQSVHPHEADKKKVMENLEKINGKTTTKEALTNMGNAFEKLANQAGVSIKAEKEERLINFKIVELQEELDTAEKAVIERDTIIKGLKCEIEGLKVENARLHGMIDGMKMERHIPSPLNPQITYTNETSTNGEKEPWYRRWFA